MSAHLHAPRAWEAKNRPMAPLPSAPLASAGMTSGGQTLDRHTQSRMSARFGHDFSSVRIHTDARAGESAAAAGANAFAAGTDIVFGAGRYLPGSRDTDRLLAHELTHVVQQSKSGPGDPALTSDRADSSEREADTLAGDAAAGRAVDVQAAPQAAIARDEDEQRQQCAPAPPFSFPGMAMAGNVTSPRPAPASPWKAWDDNPLWNKVTDDSVSGSVGIAQEGLKDLHKAAAGKSIAQAGQMESEFRLNDFQQSRGWSPSTSGTVEEIAGQKSLWQAGADLEDAENVARGGNSAMRVESTLGNTASRFSPALETAGTVGKFLSPLGVWSDANSLVDDWHKGEHADAVADGLGLTSSAIGTIDALGAGASFFGATGAGTALSGFASAANPVGAVAGSAAGGYAAGKFLRNKANTYAKENNIFHDGNDTTEEAGDAGVRVKNFFGGGTLGSILGGGAAIGSSWGTAAYAGGHALVSGVEEDAHWLWNHTFGDSGPSDEEMAANQKQADAVMSQSADEMMNSEMTHDLDESVHYSQTAHEEMPPLPAKGRR